MTKQDKELLIKDLCARLPYVVKIKFNDGTDDVYNLDGNIHGRFTENVIQAIDDLELKPYLRPMSSMTDEEINEFHKLRFTHVNYGSEPLQCVLSVDEIDWLNARNFDYRGLIEKGLAIEAPDGMYDFK